VKEKEVNHCNTSANHNETFFPLDISEQLEQCPGLQVLDIASFYQGVYLLVGKSQIKKLDLMKIWKREAFVDIIVYHDT
jgi:hypothetical protein